MNREHVLPGARGHRTRWAGPLADVAARPATSSSWSGRWAPGKTALTQGIGAALGVREPVTSPTFVIARVHRGGRLPLVHVDAYRLGSVADVDDLDLDATAGESVTVVEWGQGLVEQLADEHLEVRLDRRDDDVRTAVLVPHGPGWERAARGGAGGSLPGTGRSSEVHACPLGESRSARSGPPRIRRVERDESGGRVP